MRLSIKMKLFQLLLQLIYLRHIHFEIIRLFFNVNSRLFYQMLIYNMQKNNL